MFLVLVVGGGLGWVSLQRQREARLKWVIATIEGLGASLDYDGIGISRIQWLSGNPNPASISRRALTASEIEALGSCRRLREITMDVGVLTDDGLAALSYDTLLEKVYLFKPEISDAGVNHLTALCRLKKLDLLGASDVTDAALAQIAGLTELEEISLSGATITGSGLVHLTGLKKLGSLSLSHAPLDDVGLRTWGG